jgi:SAM-dependent methyltransferase
MFAWFKGQIKEQGWKEAGKLLGRVAWSQGRARAANKLLPPRHSCPCCGWRGRRFYDYIETGYRLANIACPRCDSHGRHRAFHWWLKNEFNLSGQEGVGLLLAPEKALAPIWATARHLRFWRLDLVAARGVDVLADAQFLPFKDGTFDFLWCHHVLEQIPDDFAAMRELKRVLREPNGVLIVSAGTHDIPDTVEFGFSDKRFSGNCRQYGRDFPQRLTRAGFEPQTVSLGLTDKEFKEYGIKSGEVFYLCRRGA